MRVIIALAVQSLINRRVTALMIILSIAVSVALLLGVEKVRHGAKQSFSSTVAGTDLIVGARSGSVQLLLYSVFRIGNATHNISWQSYQEIAAHRKVAWSIPLALGDSHRGYRVLGTTTAYFEHYQYGRNRHLAFAQGIPFNALHDVVLGAEVARTLGYKLGDKVVIAHGMGSTSFSKHEDQPFTVTGILAATGTPVDHSLHVSLQAIEAIHVDWQAGAYIPGSGGSTPLQLRELQPQQITAFLLGLKSKLATFQLQRSISNYRAEPLQAVLPGVALQELWSMLGIAENALRIISACVVVSGLFGMLTVLLTGLNERRRELAILRAVGARPGQILALVMLESALLTLCGIGLGVGLLYTGLTAVLPVLEQTYGLQLALGLPDTAELKVLGLVFSAGIFAGLVPGYRAYRYSLADGMTIRI